MFNISFKKYNKDNKIDMFNKKLIKISQDRFELRQSKNGRLYLYDYDDREVIRNGKEIEDIISCMNLESEFNKVKEVK